MARIFGKWHSSAPTLAVGNDDGPAVGDRPNAPQAPADDGRQWMRAAAQIAAAAFIGFGVILWISANWSDIDRAGRLAIVGGALIASVAAAVPRIARIPALLLAFLAAGGLLALIGQTYQTGGDPWQLFAMWALVGLPWAFAARHDALWLGWGVVAITAVGLWQMEAVPGGVLAVEPAVAVAAWMMAATIAVLISPWSPIGALTGPTRWAFRVVAMLTIMLVLQGALADLFSSRSGGGLFLLGLVVLVAVAGALMTALRPLDLVLLAFAALAVDVCLIAGVARWLDPAGDPIGGMLVLALASAGVVAGTGALLLRVVRSEAGSAPAGRAAVRLGTWPVTLLTAVGALIAALPILAFLTLSFGRFLSTGPGAYLIGAAGLAASSLALRSRSAASFGHQLAVIGLVVGFLLLGFALERDLGASAAASLLLAALATGLALALPANWVQGILGAIAAGSAAFALARLARSGFAPLPTQTTWGLMLAAACGWLASRLPSSPWRPGGLGEDRVRALDGFFAGWTALALVGTILKAGPTFLLGGALGWRGGLRAVTQTAEISLASASPLSALLASIGVALLLSHRRDLATALGLGVALVVVALSAIVPGLGGPVLLVCVAGLGQRRALALAGGAAALWVIGSFYYWLGWPLIDKAALMLAAGVMLAVLCVVSGLTRPAFALPSGAAAPNALALGLVAAGALAVGLLATSTVTAFERLIADGQRVYIALAPRDPRSLMQGDYMAVRFALPRTGPTTRRPGPGARLWAVASLDERGIATVERVSEARPRVGPSEVLLEVRAKRGQWVVASDAWFFQEGTAKRWERARFGELRVGGDGQALLVGMADEHLTPLR